MDSLLTLCRSTLRPDSIKEQELFRKVIRLYERASRSYIESEEFRIRVELVTKQVKAEPKRMWVITRDLFNELKAYKEEKPKNSVKSASNGENGSTQELAPSSPASGTEPSASDDGRSVRKASERQLARLEALLAQHCKEIEKLESKELTLDDLDSEDNSYLIAERLKKRAAKIFKRLCALKQRSTGMGGAREKRFKFSGTRYRELNVHVQRFINKHSFEERMPDCADIKRIVKLCNSKYNYCLSSRRVDELAKDVFSDVGTRLSSIRKQDFLDDFGPATANKVLKQSDDPAMLSATLRDKLKRNHKVGEQNIDLLLQKYTNQQEKEEEMKKAGKEETAEVKADNGDEGSDQSETDSSSSDEEEETTDGASTVDKEDRELITPVINLNVLNSDDKTEPSADDNEPSTSGYIPPASPVSKSEEESDSESTTTSSNSSTVTELSGQSGSHDSDDSDSESAPTPADPKSPSETSLHSDSRSTTPQNDAFSPPIRIQEVVGTSIETLPLQVKQVTSLSVDSASQNLKRSDSKSSESPPLKIGRVEGEVIVLSDSD